MKICDKDHRHSPQFQTLPEDQGQEGRHRCAGCAYEEGLKKGESPSPHLEFDFTTLPYSQAGTVRHKSPYVAFAKGYLDGLGS